MKRKHLSPEERVELDVMFEEAGLDVFGNARPADEIKPRLRSMIEDAIQAGRRWAGYVLDDAVDDGLLKCWNRWNNEQNRMRTIHNGVIVPTRSVRGTRRRNVETGKLYHQQAFWREMTWQEVRQQMDDSRKRIAAEQITISVAGRLFELKLRSPESTGPLDACARLDLDFDQYMAGEQDVA